LILLDPPKQIPKLKVAGSNPVARSNKVIIGSQLSYLTAQKLPRVLHYPDR
jgi:hypothetical protein